MQPTFDCPKCGAPVNYSNNPTGQTFTVRCNYCGSALSEPNAMLGTPAQIVQLKIDATGAASTISKGLLVLILIPVIALIAGLIAAAVGVLPLLKSGNKTSSKSSRPGFGPFGGKATTGPGSVLLTFGSEGIGPGMFTDARSIAVDASGKIYVGEYLGGRVQVFDPSGKFITQWSVDTKMPLRGMAADRSGNVYVVQSGKITRFEGSTGNRLGEVSYSGGSGFDDITSTADGGFVCAWYSNRDDIVRFDSGGKVVRTIKEAISSASGRSELNMRVAIDGMSSIYALGTFNDAVFKFSPDGKFINRFGGSGNKPGQLRAASAVAVDGKGRVYVSDIQGIQMFDGDGRYIDTMKLDGHAFGMVFNDKNEMFVVARNKVVKLAISD